MKNLGKNLWSFLKCPGYMLGLLISTIISYRYIVTHYAIGMDDTAIDLYFEQGLAPYVGRFSIFFVNKVLGTHFVKGWPWLIEAVSLLIFMLSVTLWCVLWKQVLGEKYEMASWKYVFVAGVFITCPLISEIFVFYLHNGICTGYGVCALALLCFLESIKKEQKAAKTIACCVGSGVLLAFALGFYESFMIVFLLGVVMIFYLFRILYEKDNNEKYQVGVLSWVVRLLGIGGLSLLLRSLILKGLEVAYDLNRLDIYNVKYRNLFGDLFGADGELRMMLERFYMKYYVYALAYLPITVLVISLCIIGVVAVFFSIRKKDFLLFLSSTMFVLLPILLSVIEGMATRYRSAQYVPMVGSFVVLLALIWTETFKTSKKTILNTCICVLFGGLIFVQGMDMNRWFVIDYEKYADASKVMAQVAKDLNDGYDTKKPIVFRGAYQVPFEIISPAYVDLGSKKCKLVRKFTDPLDEHLKEKFYYHDALCVAETPGVSTLQWGVTAFDGTSGQLIRFWEMHGITGFVCETDLSVIDEAEQIKNEAQMPGYPNKGYIKECENYLIVNLEN